jgi:hypothetical protein
MLCGSTSTSVATRPTLARRSDRNNGLCELGTTAVQHKNQITFQKIREGVQFFLLIFASGFGIYQFIYKDIIVPAMRPPAVTLTTRLEELGRADGMVFVRMHLVVANRGDAKVWVPALWWNVLGVRFRGEDRTVSQFLSDMPQLLKDREKSLSRFSNPQPAEVVASGYEPSYELWYQPKDETVHEQLFLVPEGRFDLLQISVNADISKSIDEYAPTRWEMDQDGMLSPILLLKGDGTRIRLALSPLTMKIILPIAD